MREKEEEEEWEKRRRRRATLPPAVPKAISPTGKHFSVVKNVSPLA